VPAPNLDQLRGLSVGSNVEDFFVHQRPALALSEGIRDKAENCEKQNGERYRGSPYKS
jgi:hypothetical protein